MGTILVTTLFARREDPQETWVFEITSHLDLIRR
jgi:hypothetical protein